MKEIFSPSHNRTVKLGRKRPVAPAPRMKLARYLQHALPAPPATCSYSDKALSVLSDIYGNDMYGDCVIAGGYHMVGVETGNAGKLFTATMSQIIADYHAIGGFDPNDPQHTDNGCDEDTAINYWTSHGFANGTKLLGSLSANAASRTEIMQGIYLCENALICMELPDAYVNPFPAGDGFVWDVAGPPVPENGHAITAVGYNTRGVIVSTWGMVGILTWEALAKYAVRSAGGSVNIVLTPDQLSKGQTKAPNGVAWIDLIADFDALGGNVPVPAPPAPPPPTPPTPPAPPKPDPTMNLTLLEAQLFAIDKLHATRGVFIVRDQAIKLVCDSLAMHWAK